jgi:hypothetical protein
MRAENRFKQLDWRISWSFNSFMPAKSAKRKSSPAKKPSPTKAEEKLPIASRPVMPAAYGTTKSTTGMLDWTWARERLTNSHNYVVVTVRPDGRPHAMGMHGLWFDDDFYFGTADTTRKAKNLAANPNCILVNEQLDELVIVEGTAKQIAVDEAPQGLAEASKKKYGWPMEVRTGGLLFKVTPRTVFVFPEKQFATGLTRWKFE